MALLAFTWSDFAQQVVSGLSTGGVYASLALALVIIYRSTGVVIRAGGDRDVHDVHRLVADEPHGRTGPPSCHVRNRVRRRRRAATDGDPAVRGAPVLTIVIVDPRPRAHLQRRLGVDLGRPRCGPSSRRSRRGRSMSAASPSRSRTSGIIVVCFVPRRAARAALQVHEGRACSARAAVNPEESRLRRDPRRLDARAGLGARGRARRGGAG